MGFILIHQWNVELLNNRIVSKYIIYFMLFFVTPEKPICAHKLHFNRGNDFPEDWAEREGAGGTPTSCQRQFTLCTFIRI